MESKMEDHIKLQHDHKSPSYQLKDNDLTPKKQNLVKLEPDDVKLTLQKNILQKIEKVKIQGIKSFRHSKKFKRPWNKQQDELLRKLVQTKGAKQWAHISSYFQERCGKQCRERWHNHLRNGIRKGQWTSDEEWILFLGVQAYGKKWSTISKMLEGRTENTLKNHWNCKMKPKKLSCQKKLQHLLGYHSFQQLDQNKLFQIIRYKKSMRQNRVDGVIEHLKNTLREFFQVKEQILGKHEIIKTPKTFAEKENSKLYDLYSFGSFGKNRQFQSTTCQKKKNRFISRQKGKIQLQFQGEDEYVSRPFQLYSNDRNEKQNDMEIESSSKESSNQLEIFYEKSDIHNQSSYQGHFEHGHQKIDFCEKYLVGDFCSPIKPNIFETIDLGQSNTKKRLFQ